MKVCYSSMLALGLITCLAIPAGVLAADSSAKPAPVIKYSSLSEKLPGGVVDWAKEMLYATGEGAMPSPQEEPNRARANLKATDYAKMDAVANLLMLIEGTSISYQATGKNYMVNDATLRQVIEGYAKNVAVLKKEKLQQDGCTIIRVTVGTRMYGPDTPGAALLQKLSQTALENLEPPAPVTVEVKGEPAKTVQPVPETKSAETKPLVLDSPAADLTDINLGEPKAAEAKPEPPKAADVKAEEPKHVEAMVEEAKPADAKPEPPKADEKATAKPAEPKTLMAKVVDAKPVAKSEPKPAPAVSTTVKIEGPYTSVIIDTLGFNVMRAMSPKIRTKDGDEVWGTIKMDPDEVQDHGPVAYTRTLADARKSSRAGSKPLELKAIGRAGGSRMCDAVLSDDDVAKLKSADSVAKPPFLIQLKVVFVVDPAKAF